MNISVFGVGYVGLVTGVCLAEIGHNVCCMDIDLNKINQLNNDELPIYEEGLVDLFKKNKETGRLGFSNAFDEAVNYGEVLIIAVGTPSASNGAADLQYVEAVAERIGQSISRYACIVNKSTVPVGTAASVEKIIQTQLDARGVDLTFAVASNPEFLREGQAVRDCLDPDRIVIGANSEQSIRTLKEMYQPFIVKGVPFLEMGRESAELTKYAANAFLATKISFINEVSSLAESLGANIHEVVEGMSLDGRINRQFLNPGCGFGGSCFPKDVAAIKYMADQCQSGSAMLSAVLEVNKRQQQILFDKINKYFSGDLSGKTIGVWGLAFKPNTDDIRCASSIVLMEKLWEAGAKVRVFDPMATGNIKCLYKEKPSDDIVYCDSLDLVTTDSDVLAVVTEWRDFDSPDFDKIRETLRFPAIFDGRNMYDAGEVRKKGLEYFGIGC